MIYFDMQQSIFRSTQQANTSNLPITNYTTVQSLPALHINIVRNVEKAVFHITMLTLRNQELRFPVMSFVIPVLFIEKGCDGTTRVLKTLKIEPKHPDQSGQPESVHLWKDLRWYSHYQILVHQRCWVPESEQVTYM